MNWYHELNLHVHPVFTQSGATKACHGFGNGWDVAKVSDGALVCTLSGVQWDNTCNGCNDWRLLTWIDGSNEYRKGEFSFYDNFPLSTKAGKYYGGHKPCENGDTYETCGDWKTPGIFDKY